MIIPFFQVDAFARRPFEGNPAAVMPLTEWLDDKTLAAIAAENNLSETAFTVPSTRDGAVMARISAMQAPSLQPTNAAVSSRSSSITANTSAAISS